MAIDNSDLTDWERRTLLKALGPAGLGLVAGCIGGDDDSDGGDDGSGTDDDGTDDDPSPDELVDPRDYVIEGQTLTLPGAMNPEEMHLMVSEWVRGDIFSPEQYEYDTQLGHATNEMTHWGRWLNSAFWEEPGDGHPLLYESVDVTEELIRLEIREDATWQDGEPVTAKDALLTVSTYGYTPDAPGQLYYGSMMREMRAPDGPDGKVIEQEALPVWVEESDGWLHHQPGFIINFHASPFARHGGVRAGAPAHKWPYDELYDMIWEIEEAKYEAMEEHPELWDDYDAMMAHREEDELGESLFDSWWRENMPEEWVSPREGEGAIPRMSRLLEQLLGEDEDAFLDLLEQSRDPDWYVGHGLYELDEVVGTQGYSLVPNEEHRLYGEHTFDEVFIEWTEQEDRTRTAVMSEHLDYADVTMSPETTANLPDSRIQVNYPQSDGYAISFNHAYWPGDSVRVRQALMYATNKENIAMNIHPDTTAPIQTPGWDNWGADIFLEEDWVDEHLTTYEHDLDRATELMEQADYELIDGAWHDADGDPVQDILATFDENAVFEETVVDQWRQFGIDIQTQLFDEATFQDRWEGSSDPAEPGTGEFAVSNSGWPSSNFAGWFPDIGGHVGGGAISFIERLRARHWFGEDATEEIAAEEYRSDGYGRDFGWEYLTFEVPPAGDPDSEERIPFAMSWAHERASRDVYEFTGDNQPVEDGLYEPDRLNVENLYQAFAWTLNWFLWDLPLVRNQGQLFINVDNFLWGQDIPSVDGIGTDVDAVHEMWEFFGQLGGPHYYPSSNMVWGNPEDPEADAELNTQ